MANRIVVSSSVKKNLVLLDKCREPNNPDELVYARLILASALYVNKDTFGPRYYLLMSSFIGGSIVLALCMFGAIATFSTVIFGSSTLDDLGSSRGVRDLVVLILAFAFYLRLRLPEWRSTKTLREITNILRLQGLEWVLVSEDFSLGEGENLVGCKSVPHVLFMSSNSTSVRR